MSSLPASVSTPPADGSPDRRELLLAAGLALFDEVPLEQITVDSVAERAGVARGLVGYYFGTKDKLYLAISTRFGETIRARLLENPHEDPGMWLETDVRLFVNVVADHPVAMRNTTGRVFSARTPRTPMSTFTVARILDVLGVECDAPVLHTVIASWGLHCVDLALRWLEQPAIDREVIARVMVSQLRAALAVVSASHPEYGLPTAPLT